MMRSILHPVLCVLLALGLAVAGYAQAGAGVAMMRAETWTEIVICGAGGAHVVVLDASGNVVAKGEETNRGEACRRCPACVMAQAAANPSSPEAVRPVTRVARADAFPFNTPEPAAAYGLPVARGPPARA